MTAPRAGARKKIRPRGGGKRDYHKRPVKTVADIPSRHPQIMPESEIAFEDKPVMRSPAQLIEAIVKGAILPHEILHDERILCIGELLLRGVPQFEIANIFKISPAMVTADKRRLVQRAAEHTTELDTRGVVGTFLNRKDFLYGRAVAEKDFRLASDITNDVVDRLARFGFLQPVGPVPKTLTGIVVKHQEGDQSGNATGSAVGGSTSVGVFEVSGLGDSALAAIERILAGDGAQGAGPPQP